MVLLTWLLGVSRGDTWLFLPDLVEVRDVGACVVRLWSHVVAPACVLRCCFSIVFDSTDSAGVVFGPTLVVGHGISLFRCFVVLCGVRCQTVVVAACSSCVASSVSCERECSLYHELRVAFLQVLGLFEFIAYLTGLNSNPFGSSDPWVAARPSGVPGGGPGGRVVTLTVPQVLIKIIKQMNHHKNKMYLVNTTKV
ncbi:hypothetical protein Taro_000140 [Colocasia esculenta]|uniref:Uncharacterized protein n=1 Tax=Colocasia esculenta TaxID=4460 RepID=A0A843TFP1_COLES|nr:hypothetical protein [Colocasia esculenta]